jgi:hypothetical protein
MSPLFGTLPYTPPPTPPARSLEAVLKGGSTNAGRASATSGVTVVGVELLIGTYGYSLTGSDANKYGNVYLPGTDQPIKIPKLKGAVDGAWGQPAYILSTPGRQILLGTVSL